MFKKVSFYLKTGSWLLVFFSIPSEAISQSKCSEQFRNPQQMNFLNNNKSPKNKKSTTKKTQNKEPQIEIYRHLAHYITTGNLTNAIKLIAQYPALKDVRFQPENFPSLVLAIDSNHINWCPKGWGLSQLAAYLKNEEMLDSFLKMEVSFRTKKKKGNQSIEDNALHISIKRNFKEGVDLLFNYQDYEPAGKKRNRFIDEKSADKKTPWYLALEMDLEIGNFLFTNLVGKRNPSGYTESYVFRSKMRRDGFESAQSASQISGSLEYIRLAKKYLKIKSTDAYEEYKKLKEVSGGGVGSSL